MDDLLPAEGKERTESAEDFYLIFIVEEPPAAVEEEEEEEERARGRKMHLFFFFLPDAACIYRRRIMGARTMHNADRRNCLRCHKNAPEASISQLCCFIAIYLLALIIDRRLGKCVCLVARLNNEAEMGN